MDPELLKEFQDNQAKLSSLQSSFQSGDFKAGYVRSLIAYRLNLRIACRVAALMNEEETRPVANTSAQNTPKKAAKKRR
jgi:hypothetical protein